MYHTKRVVTNEGWGIKVTRSSTDDSPHATVYVGGCQHGHGSVWVTRPPIQWIGRIRDHRLLSWHVRCININDKRLTYIPVPMPKTPRWADTGDNDRYGHQTILRVGQGVGSCALAPTDWSELYTIAKVARKDKNGAVIFDWIAEHAPREAEKIMNDTFFSKRNTSDAYYGALV